MLRVDPADWGNQSWWSGKVKQFHLIVSTAHRDISLCLGKPLMIGVFVCSPLSSLYPQLSVEGLWECHLTVNSQVRCVRSEARLKVGLGCDMDPVSVRGNIVVKMSSHLTSVTDLLQTDQSENSNGFPVIRHPAPGHWVTVTWLGKSLFSPVVPRFQNKSPITALFSPLHPPPSPEFLKAV